ncbi:MAG: type II toxin-antitoxin system VapC family toxin [Chloroflexota bacterium]
MNLYLDASALVKRYVDEVGSEEVVAAMSLADTWSMCRIGFVETVGAVAREGGPEDVARAKRDWVGFHVIELDQALAERAATLASEHGLRSLDAIHLAAALGLSVERRTVATWDARLHQAARERGLRTLPAALA